nr:conjugal transfer protein TraN [Aliidiomarina quisquiliarum]
MRPSTIKDESTIEESESGAEGGSPYRIIETITQLPNGCFDRLSNEIKNAGGESGYPGEYRGVCSFDSYEVLDESSGGYSDTIVDLIPPLFPGDNGRATWKVNLDGYACEPFNGEDICINPYGEDGEICESWYDWFGRHDDDLSEFPEEHTALVDSCALYKEENCTRRESECADGFVDENGHCRIKNVRYECSTGVGGTRTVTTESTSCDAMIPCAGGDCDDTANESNNDFVKAATQASILHEMSVDNNCIGEDGDTGDCEVFTGTFGSCARAVGLAGAVKLGGPDCCDDPTAVGIKDYIVAARQVAQFDAVRNTASWAATPVKGAYDKIASGAGTAWSKVTSSFTSGAESLAGNATSATAEGNIIDKGMQALQDATMKWMAENLPSGVTHAIFATELGQDGITTVVSDPPQWSEGMQNVGNFAQGLMTAYSYYTMAKLFMDIAFQCDEDESEVAGARMQKQCVYLGSGSCRLNLVVTGCVRKNYRYCCFNSILARIIMEQAAEQLDRPLGSGEACRGLTLAELSQLDWDLIDLESEWIPLMFESGYILNDPSEESLTGAGRTMNSDAREAVSKRTKDRFRNISDGDTRDIDSEMRETLDCSKYPRPAVCNYPAGGG